MIRLTLLLAFCLWLIYELAPAPAPQQAAAPEPNEPLLAATGEVTELTLETGEVWTIDRVITPGEPPTPVETAALPSASEPGPEPVEAVETDASEVLLLYVTGTRVNLRAGPSTNNEIVTALTQGTATEFIAEAPDGWFQVRDQASGAVGFMSGDFLSPSAP